MAIWNKLTTPPREDFVAMIDKGMTLDQIAAHLGISRSSVSKIKRTLKMSDTRHGRKIHIAREALQCLAAAGLSQAKIARELGCGVDAVAAALKREGIRTKKQINDDAATDDFREAVIDVVPSQRAIEWADPFGLRHRKNFPPMPTGAPTGATVVFPYGERNAA